MDRVETPANEARRIRQRRKRRLERWPHSRWLRPAVTCLLGLLIVSAPQLLGGVLPWTVSVIAVQSVLCLAALACWAPAAQARAPAVGLVMCAAALWTAVQAQPLGCSLVSAIASDSAQKTHAAQLALGNASPVRCALSQDPGATQAEIVKGVAIVSTFLAAWLLAASDGRKRVFWMVACSSLAMSLVALAHGLLEIDRVFGIYTPVALKRTLLLAPLMNLNNLGAFAAMGVPLWIGLTYRDSDANIRLLGYVAIAVSATTAILTMSRGAVGQLLGSLAVMPWLVLASQRHVARTNEPRTTRRFGIAAACLLGLGTGAYLEGSELLPEFTDGDVGKLDLIASGFRLALKHPWVGVGRGAFSSAFVAVEGSTTRYVYPENFIAQWTSEWGVPIGVILLVAVSGSLLRACRSAASLAHLSALTSLAAFTTQNLVDFGFELTGVAVVAAALLAANIAPSPGRTFVQTDRAHLLPSMRAIGLVVVALGTLALAILVPRVPRQQVQALEASLRQTMAKGDRERFRRDLTTAITLHPSEPVFALLAAAESIRHIAPEAGRWLNRSMQLAPGWAAPHALAFRWLWQRGHRDQALVELRAAMEIEPSTSHEDVCQLARTNPRWVLAAAPRNQRRREYLETAGFCLPAAHPVSPALDEALLKEFPDSVWALARSSQRSQTRGNTDESVAILDRVIRAHPDHRWAILARANVLIAGGRVDEVFRANQETLAQLSATEQAQLLTSEAIAFAHAGEVERARSAVADVRRRVATDADSLAESYALQGRVHLELHQPGEAFGAFREAYKINPDTRYLVEIGRLAEVLGDRRQALWAYINLCQREPSGESCAKKSGLLAPQEMNIGP